MSKKKKKRKKKKQEIAELLDEATRLFIDPEAIERAEKFNKKMVRDAAKLGNIFIGGPHDRT